MTSACLWFVSNLSLMSKTAAASQSALNFSPACARGYSLVGLSRRGGLVRALLGSAKRLKRRQVGHGRLAVAEAVVDHGSVEVGAGQVWVECDAMVEILQGALEVLFSVAHGAPVEAGGDQVRLELDSPVQVCEG